MKVCLINAIYKPYTRGGAEVLSEKIVQGLKSQGHEVFVITNGHANVEDEVDGVPVFRLSPSNLFSFLDINDQPLCKRVL
mgnify:CR=1 FL=1